MKKNNKKGFTLVELVIVVAVMAILVAVAIPTIGSIRSSAQSSVDKSNAQTIESIIKLEEADQTSDAGLTADNVEAALAEAKLGIAAGKTFYYDYDSGDCSYGATQPTGLTNGYKIEFTAGTGDAAGTVVITATLIGSTTPAA